MAAKKGKESKAAKRGSYYKVEGDKATMAKKFCPRCGPGMIMADHKDRTACGKCGYTEFKK
jgi:small subunit ribosomal protein S27Ae